MCIAFEERCSLYILSEEILLINNFLFFLFNGFLLALNRCGFKKWYKSIILFFFFFFHCVKRCFFSLKYDEFM